MLVRLIIICVKTSTDNDDDNDDDNDEKELFNLHFNENKIDKI